MNSVLRSARVAGLTTFLALAAATSASAAAPAKARAQSITVTEAEVAESNTELEQAYGALVDMWTKDFTSWGRRFERPRLISYRGNVRTSCGIMSANNAAYCSAANAIFFDEVFVAAQRKEAARQLGTDGDMAGVGIIAHEMGHAVAQQLGVVSRIPYENEATADCLAGAFGKQSQQDGSLEKGDLEEAFAGLAAAGDPTVELTGNERLDVRRQARAQMMGHGTSEQRMANFRTGFNGGPAVCLNRVRRG